MTFLDFTFVNTLFSEPVLVDIITGCVYRIPDEQWKQERNISSFYGIPVYDAPVLMDGRNLVGI